MIQCLIQTLVRSQVWVYWLARFVDSDNSRRPYDLRRCAQAFVTRATEVPNGRTLRCSCRAVTLSAWIHARAGDGGVRKGSAVFFPYTFRSASSSIAGEDSSR